jgi:hypothetical protein
VVKQKDRHGQDHDQAEDQVDVFPGTHPATGFGDADGLVCGSINPHDASFRTNSPMGLNRFVPLLLVLLFVVLVLTACGKGGGGY